MSAPDNIRDLSAFAARARLHGLEHRYGKVANMGGLIVVGGGVDAVCWASQREGRVRIRYHRQLGRDRAWAARPAGFEAHVGRPGFHTPVDDAFFEIGEYRGGLCEGLGAFDGLCTAMAGAAAPRR